MTESELIAACKRKDAQAQKAFYDRFASKMLGVSRRYVRDHAEAEDVMIQAMYKALSRIQQFRASEGVEYWLRSITVNEALMQLRKRREDYRPQENLDYLQKVNPTAGEQLAAEELLAMLDHLPTGYRTIFNLYAIEGYKHREIADLLGISINTSKSQLLLARKKLREMIVKDKPDV